MNIETLNHVIFERTYTVYNDEW